MNRSKKYSIATTKIRKKPREETKRAESAKTSMIIHMENKKREEVGAGVPTVANGKALKERNLLRLAYLRFWRI